MVSWCSFRAVFIARALYTDFLRLYLCTLSCNKIHIFKLNLQDSDRHRNGPGWKDVFLAHCGQLYVHYIHLTRHVYRMPWWSIGIMVGRYKVGIGLLKLKFGSLFKKESGVSSPELKLEAPRFSGLVDG